MTQISADLINLGAVKVNTDNPHYGSKITHINYEADL